MPSSLLLGMRKTSQPHHLVCLHGLVVPGGIHRFGTLFQVAMGNRLLIYLSVFLAVIAIDLGLVGAINAGATPACIPYLDGLALTGVVNGFEKAGFVITVVSVKARRNASKSSRSRSFNSNSRTKMDL